MLLGGEGESEMGRLQERWVPGPGLREDRGGMATAGDSAEMPPSLGQSSYSDPLACPPPGLGDDSGLPPRSACCGKAVFWPMGRWRN